jgi:molecular chaperone DnaK
MFYTTRDDQQRMIVEVVQRKNEIATATSLGHFEFGPIRKPRKNYPVEITLGYDAEGVVTVSARDAHTNEQMHRAMTAEEGTLDQALLQQRAWLQDMRLNGV